MVIPALNEMKKQKNGDCMKKTAKALLCFILIITMLIPAGTVSFAAANFTTKSRFTGKTYTHYGTYAGTTIKDMIDVSEHNGLINWYKIKALGIDDAIIRVGYRGYGQAGTMREDAYFYDNIEGAQKAGVNVGIYFYSQALNTTEAVEEANFALKRLKKYKLQLPVFYDYEFAEVSDGRLDAAWNSGKLNKTKMTNNVVAFCDAVKKAGFLPGIYSSSGFYTYQYNADTFITKGYAIWNAYYTTNSTSGSFWPNKNHVYKYWQYGGGNVQGCCGAPSVAWLKVTYSGKTGYVSSQYVNFTGAAAGTILAKNVSLRSGGGSGYSQIGTLPKGAKVTIHAYPTDTNTDLNFYYYSGFSKPDFSLEAGKTNVLVKWKKVTGASYYRVYTYDKSSGKYERLAQTTATSFNYTGLKRYTEYVLLVRAFTKAGTGSKYSTKDNRTTITVPDAPKLTLKQAGQNALSLSWNAVKGASFYRLYSYDASTKKYTRLAQVTDTSYLIKKLKAGDTCYLLVRAFNKAEAGSEYTTGNLLTAYTLPEAPNFTLTPFSYSVKLQWNRVNGAKFYRVYAYDAQTGKYRRLIETKATNWEHGSLKGNCNYTYLVRAFNRADEGNRYSTAQNKSVKTLLRKPQFNLEAVDEQTIRVNWNAIGGAAYYRVYLFNEKTQKYRRIGQTTETRFTYDKAQGGRLYTFLVRAFEKNGSGSSYSGNNHISVQTPMQNKAQFELTSDAKGQVLVSWQEVPFADFYRVYSYDKATNKYARVVSGVRGTSYRIENLVSGKEYTFLVRAFSAEYIAADSSVADNKSIVVQ